MRLAPPSLAFAAALAALAALATACFDDDPMTADAGGTGSCDLTMSLEVRAPDGAYVPMASAGGGAELVLGFQGFRYLYARGRFATAPVGQSAAISVQLDGEALRSQPIGPVETTADPAGGGFVTSPWRVFFNDDPLPSLIDHGLQVELHVGKSCHAGGHTVLRYDEGCYEGPDGSRVCPDGGP